MSEPFDQEWAESTVALLRAVGVEFAQGLADAEIEAIGESFRVSAPPELEQFLRAGCPVSPKWARWVEGPEVVAADAREWIDRAFEFDVTQGQYWHPSFGQRPDDADQAVQVALAVVRAAPPLIPIYAHRFIATSPTSGQRAVLSVWQAVDSIFYGNDLADYFTNEFQVERSAWAAVDAPRVPVWEDLFDLFGEGGDL